MSLAKLSRRKVRVVPPKAPLTSVLPAQVTREVDWRMRDCTTVVEVVNRFFASTYYNVGYFYKYPPNLKAMRPPRCMTAERALWIQVEPIILQRIADYVPPTDHVATGWTVELPLEPKDPS